MTSTSASQPTPTPTSHLRELLDGVHRLYHRSPNAAPGSRLPHPGDILYWVGCVGAAAALLLVATR